MKELMHFFPLFVTEKVTPAPSPKQPKKVDLTEKKTKGN